MPAPSRLPIWIPVLAVAILAINLRPGPTSVGPVLAEIKAVLGMSPTVAGLLTALPGAAFAIFGALAVLIALRAGTNGTILLGAIASALGLMLRAVTDSTALFLIYTALAYAGMAVANVLVPSFVKRHFPNRSATMMSVYSTGLALGATIPTAIAAPIAATGPDGWRISLGIWGFAMLVAALPWVVLAVRERKGGGGPSRSLGGSMFAVVRSPKAVALGCFFGIQSTQAYVQFGWIAQIYRDGGLAPELAGLMLSIIPLFGLPAGLVMPGILSKVRDTRPIMWAFGLLLTAGYLGVWLAPTQLPWLWACLLGLSGAAFPTALALVTARTRDPRVTTQLSGFAQSVGYTMAAFGPFLVGAVFELTGSWTVPLLLLAASGAAMTASGLIASAPGYVDDELAR